MSFSISFSCAYHFDHISSENLVKNLHRDQRAPNVNFLLSSFVFCLWFSHRHRCSSRENPFFFTLFFLLIIHLKHLYMFPLALNNNSDDFNAFMSVETNKIRNSTKVFFLCSKKLSSRNYDCFQQKVKLDWIDLNAFFDSWREKKRWRSVNIVIYGQTFSTEVANFFSPCSSFMKLFEIFKNL